MTRRKATRSSSLARSLSLVGGAVRTTWESSRRGTVVAVGLQLLTAVSALGVVFASKVALEALLTGETGFDRGLVLGLGILALATTLSGAAAVLQQQQQRVLGEQLGQTLYDRVIARCVEVDLLTWESTAFMDRLDRVRTNALQRPQAAVTALLAIGGSLLGVVSMAIALVTIEPLLVPVMIAAGVPVVLLSRIASRLEFAFATRVNNEQRQRMYLKGLLTARHFAAEVRAFEAGPPLRERHRRLDRAFLAALRAHARKRQVIGIASVLSSALALTATLLLIVALVDRGRISLAEAGSAAIAARLLGGQLSTVFGSISSLIESIPFLDDLDRFLQTPVDPTATVTTPASFERELRLDHVSFRYPGAEREAVDDASLVLPRGAVVALVGENGSGKSTLAKIVAGLYEPHTGSRSLDGGPATGPHLRPLVSVLFQDFVRYLMTAGENIAIADGRRPVDPEAVVAAARRAGIDEAVRSLPSGYDTPLGMELASGSDLSGGQWQRLALARAFYRDSPLIVLDEPTAAMDPRAEHELFNDVRTMLDGRTALLISHRYSSVRLADYIYVMHAGRIVEQGTHVELVARGGRYAELYALQASSYLAADA